MDKMKRQENVNQRQGDSVDHEDCLATRTSSFVPKSPSVSTGAHPLTFECDKDEDNKYLTVCKRMMEEIVSINNELDDGNKLGFVKHIVELWAQIEQDIDSITTTRKSVEQLIKKIIQDEYKLTGSLSIVEFHQKMKIHRSKAEAVECKLDEIKQIVDTKLKNISQSEHAVVAKVLERLTIFFRNIDFAGIWQ